MSDELKPCLRCGSHSIKTRGATDLKFAIVFCDACGLSTKYHTSLPGAIYDWNTRPDQWTLTSDKLPERWVPVWAGNNDPTTAYQMCFDGGLWWDFKSHPELIRGAWFWELGDVQSSPPKRWRYMLGP